MDDIYKNIEEYNANKKRKILIVFDDMITDMLSNKKPNVIVTELFIRGIKLNISYVSVTVSYSAVPKNIRLNSSRYFEDFMKYFKEVTHATLASDNLLCFRKNLSERI